MSIFKGGRNRNYGTNHKFTLERFIIEIQNNMQLIKALEP